MSVAVNLRARRGAHVRARTGDLFLTKEVLCQLSYVGPWSESSDAWRRRRGPYVVVLLVGREGIEPPQSLDG
jgi:hypothetical protein